MALTSENLMITICINRSLNRAVRIECLLTMILAISEQEFANYIKNIKNISVRTFFCVSSLSLEI